MPGLKSQKTQNSFLDALHSEIVAGSENLSSWIKHIHSQGVINSLFELETWLKGIRSFLNLEHLPLADSEKDDLLSRSFASEFKIVRHAVQICETHACNVINAGQAEVYELEKIIENRMQKERILDVHISGFLEQVTPVDSMSQLLDSLNDLRISLDAYQRLPHPGYQLFLTLGRNYRRELKYCRYIDMLIRQRFQIQYDLVENRSLVEVLRSIPDETVRQNVALALLYLFRFLKYLKIVHCDLQKDRPLRHHLVIFSLLHEEMADLSNFLKNRLFKGKEAGLDLRSAAELVAYSLRTESRRVLSKELISVSQEMEPTIIFSRIEDSHGLILNCCQRSVLSLVGAVDKNFDEESLFPKRTERIAVADRIRQDLWDLRQWLMDILENETAPDSNKIIERLTAFKEESLQSLMYRDWAGFEIFMETLAISNNSNEILSHMRKFINFIEDLIQEVSKRGIYQKDIKPS